jgi:hypothetical protein
VAVDVEENVFPVFSFIGQRSQFANGKQVMGGKQYQGIVCRDALTIVDFLSNVLKSGHAANFTAKPAKVQGLY